MGREVLAFWLAPAVPPIFPAPEAQGSLYGYSLGWMWFVRQPYAKKGVVGVKREPEGVFTSSCLIREVVTEGLKESPKRENEVAPSSHLVEDEDRAHRDERQADQEDRESRTFDH